MCKIFSKNLWKQFRVLRSIFHHVSLLKLNSLVDGISLSLSLHAEVYNRFKSDKAVLRIHSRYLGVRIPSWQRRQMWDTRGITRSRQTTHDLQKSVYPFSSPHVWHHIPPSRTTALSSGVPFVVAWKLFIYVFKTPSGLTSAALPLPHKLYIFNIITSRMYICVQPLSWWIYGG